MKRLDFLKFALHNKCHLKSAWMVSAFSIIRESEEEWLKDPYVGRIVSLPYGYSFVNSNKELEPIEGTSKNQPVFAMLEEITVDPSWLPNIKEPVVTLIGSLICNAVLLVENFGEKVPFIPENIEIKNIEKFVIQNRTDTDEPGKIKLSEYLNMGIAIEYLKTISNLSVYSLTEKNILPPEGLKEFKAKLDKEFEGKLSDPVMLAEYEKRLLEFDDEFMKGDPSNGKLIAGKVRANARRKLFLSSGAEGGLKGDMVPITQSLLEGTPLNPENFVAQTNGARSGSYFRGIDTVKGGVSFKIMIRALSTFEVVEGNCGSLMGIPRVYTKYNIENLVGRRISGTPEGKIVENINEANNYLGKVVRVRSTQYCKSPGQTYCTTCAGERLSRFKKGLAIPATDMTSAILAASMAAMHKNTTTTAKIDYSTCFS